MSEWEIGVLFYLGPFVAVGVLSWMLWTVWKHYIQFQNITNDNWVLVEIMLPREIFKSPRSMEIIFGAFQQKYAGSWLTKLTQGTVRTWFTIEMVSLEGEVHFYIRCLRIFKHLIESQIYAQYPGIEIREAEDYVQVIRYGIDKDWGNIWGGQLELTEEDAYPIKTYVDYGLDNESLKEEVKTDPISFTLEYLSSLGPGEYAFIQIMVQAAKERFKKPGTWLAKQDWKDEGKILIRKLSKLDEASKAGKDTPVIPSMFKLTPGETEVIKAVERGLGKIGFDCGIRIMYAAREGNYSLPNQLGISNLFAQYNTLNLNGFKFGSTTGVDSVLQDWLGISKINVKKLKAILLDAYRQRSYFYPPYQYKPFVLNTEELATIFHFPGGVAGAGGLKRVASKKGEPPLNLPI